MKKILFLGLFGLMIFGGSITTVAQEEQSYKSNGITAFYGSYESQEESTLESTKDARTQPEKENKNLPSTGERSNDILKNFGKLLLGVTGVFLLKKRGIKV